MLKKYSLNEESAKDNYLAFLLKISNINNSHANIIKEMILTAHTINNQNSFLKIYNHQIHEIILKENPSFTKNTIKHKSTKIKKILENSCFAHIYGDKKHEYFQFNKRILKDYFDDKKTINISIKTNFNSLNLIKSNETRKIKCLDLNRFCYVNLLKRMFSKDFSVTKSKSKYNLVAIVEMISKLRIYNTKAAKYFFDFKDFDFASRQHFINVLNELVLINILYKTELGHYALNRKLIPSSEFLESNKLHINFNFHRDYVNIKNIEKDNSNTEIEELKDELEINSDEIQQILTGDKQ